MTDDAKDSRTVVATREVAASAAVIFELIADPSQQPRWDGNDNLAEAPVGQRVHRVGEVFTMVLTGGSVRENHVVEFDEGRRIAWRPADPGQQPAGHLWRWELEPTGESTTLVTHTYDWSQLTDEHRIARARSTTSEMLQASLGLLAEAVEARSGTRLRVETRLAVLGRGGHGPGLPLNVPIVPASNFRAAEGGQTGREYARDDGTPSWEAFEQLLGDLEGGPAVCFSSGMAAIAAVLDLLPAGARVVAPRDSYTGLRGLLADGEAAGGRWQVRTVDMTEDDELAAAVRDADLVWLETPSNPLLEVVDIAEVAATAAEAGALVAVDNTFATPLLQSPLDLGADFVVHSATKFIGGHSDLLLGAVVVRGAEDHARLVRRRVVAGATPGALECFLALRGARTLALRLRQAQESAGELARRLQTHPAVGRVRYPGLRDDPHHARAGRQMRGFGAVLSFEVEDAETAVAVCDHVAVIAQATSLGGVESTIERRAKLPGQEHVPAGLVRLSVGCEHVDDLWADLAAALDAVTHRATGQDTDACGER